MLAHQPVHDVQRQHRTGQHGDLAGLVPASRITNLRASAIRITVRTWTVGPAPV